ncbi:LamG domain-containing protein [Gimesia aquarii]|uniref:LamG-like jellyroll fold domain-containing protein n=1 Tax=Gimesia aquarii TaxID=2527964 RepID=A0A517VP03_9PLAN|nr:LamG domain-containing protein [Gimesia aquarii]QDT94754.1 hypothetical protein V144x_01850 [Gimesia aquarii]
MASHIWIGGAPAVAQIDSVTFPSDAAAGQIVNFVIGVKTLSVTLTGANQSEIITEVVAAWNASTIPEYAEITASVGLDSNDIEDGTMKLTADTAGKPFAVTVSIGSGNNEIQVITLGGTTATGGTFTLTYDGQTTGNIAYNADATTVDTVLEALSNIGVGDVTVTGSAGGPWTVEFTGTLAGTNVALMTINVENLTGGVNEVQTISSPSNPTGGTFTLSFGGQATTGIAYNASAATVQAALEALSTIPTGSVACAGGSLPDTPITVTFQDELASMDVALLEADASGLTGVTGSAVETQTGGSDIADKAVNSWKFESGTQNGTSYDVTDTINSKVLTGGSFFVINNQLVAGGIDGKCVSAGQFGFSMDDSAVASFDENEPFSIALWVKPSSSGERSVLAIRHSNKNESSDASTYPSTLNSDYDYALTMEPGSVVKFDVKKQVGFHTLTTIGTLTTNAWNLVVAIWDPANTTLSIGINGGALENAGGLTVGTATSSNNRYLSVLSQNVQTLSGFLDEITIFREALTLANSQTIYNSGNGDFYPFPTDGNNEIQTLTLTGSPTAGSVTVRYQGEGVNVPHNSTAAAAEALLDTVSTIGSGNTNVTGGPWPGTPLVVEFINDLALTNVELLEIDTSALTMFVSETTPGVTAPTGKVETTVSPLTKSTITASEGPNHWNIPANWNTNTVPVTSDTVYISDSEISILYGLDQSAVTLAALHIEQTFSGFIGLPRTNSDGLSYFEYRDLYLKIGATNLFIGDKEGDGSDRIKIDLGSVQSTVLITDSGDGEDANTPAILLLGAHVSNVININRGSLGVAFYPTEESTIATLRQAFFDDAADDTTVYLGDGVTINDIIKSGGVLDINSNTASLEQTAGTTTIHAGTHTLLNILDGSLNYNSVGTASEINLSGASVLIFDQDRRPKNVIVINKLSDESEIFDESGSIANPVIDMENTGDLSTLNMGKNFKLTFGATT